MKKYIWEETLHYMPNACIQWDSENCGIGRRRHLRNFTFDVVVRLTVLPVAWKSTYLVKYLSLQWTIAELIGLFKIIS